MDEWGIDGVVNLSGHVPGTAAQHAGDAARRGRGQRRAHRRLHRRRLQLVRTATDYGEAMAAQLERGAAPGRRRPQDHQGPRASAIPAPTGEHLLAVDDPGLDPLFEKAGALGHAGGHPHRRSQGVLAARHARQRTLGRAAGPPRVVVLGARRPVAGRQLYDAVRAAVARHPKTTFIGVHFGNDPEDPDNVARMLDKYPNFFIDTAARVPEIGRHAAGQDAALLREVPGPHAVRHRHRHRRRRRRHDVRLDRRRRRPPAPTRSASSRRPGATSRPPDRQFESPTPIQGRWKIDGIGLPEPVLRKIYFDNAARMLRWRPPGDRAVRRPPLSTCLTGGPRLS